MANPGDMGSWSIVSSRTAAHDASRPGSTSAVMVGESTTQDMACRSPSSSSRYLTLFKIPVVPLTIPPSTSKFCMTMTGIPTTSGTLPWRWPVRPESRESALLDTMIDLVVVVRATPFSQTAKQFDERLVDLSRLTHDFVCFVHFAREAPLPNGRQLGKVTSEYDVDPSEGLHPIMDTSSIKRKSTPSHSAIRFRFDLSAPALDFR